LMWNGVCLQEKEHHHGTLITKTATQAILEVFLYISSVKKSLFVRWCIKHSTKAWNMNIQSSFNTN